MRGKIVVGKSCSSDHEAWHSQLSCLRVPKPLELLPYPLKPILGSQPNDRNGDHLVRLVRERSKRQQGVWNPLSKALMRLSLVKVHDVRFETAFARGLRYSVRSILMPLVSATRVQSFARICDQYPGQGIWVCAHTALPPAIVARHRDRAAFNIG